MILDGRDVRLSYFVAGEGPPVTLLHGFTQSGRSWRELISCMPQGWMWIVPDLRGHGETRTRGEGPCTMEACTSDLELLWDHLGVSGTHVAGYSMGGRLALHVAATRPERVLSLLTVGAHAGLDQESRNTRRLSDEELAERIEREGVEPFVDYWSGLPLFAGLQRRGDAYLAQLRAERMKNTAAGLACSLRGMGAGAMQPVWDELAVATFPCTFVAGELDGSYVEFATRLAASVPNGKAEVVPAAGHAAHLEFPDAFAEVLTSHLTAAAGARTSSSTRE